MAGKALEIFATKSDWEALLAVVEAQCKLQYVKTAFADTPNIERMESLLAMPDWGTATTGDIVREPSYLVADRELPIETREVPQRRGGIKYAIDQLLNPKTIRLQPSGTFENKCLIAGRIDTAYDEPESLQLFELFRKEVRHQFLRIQEYYVGKQAAQLLDNGWRLTQRVKAPSACDLRRL